ncbi:MAG: formylmethanofuran dehydrogenase subunit B [Euryarchaeota archaeon]|nr:formylmethanofuran dehydrogenase subunit B [Euryarchaeota archaeon]
MDEKYYVCTGCALLCDDIEIECDGNRISRVNSACRKGVARMKGCQDPLICSIIDQEADIDDAIKESAEILKNADNPLIFGLGNSTIEAQKKAIELAKKVHAYIDDTSSFCQGPVVEAILNERIRSCTLDEVRHQADVIIYWGADPANSHPRHLSKYSYFPRGKERQRGWEEDRTAIVIDVRHSDTAEICKDHFYQIPPQADRELIDALTIALSGKVPKVSFGMGSKKILELANILKKAQFGTIFVGLGLVYSLNDLDPLVKLMEKLNEVSNFHLVPMVGQYNMRGADQTMFNETGYINRVRFDTDPTGADVIRHGPECSAIELLRSGEVDAALVIGSDPMSSLPRSIAEHLLHIPVINIDPCMTQTSRNATVTIPCALGGVESGGSAIRMDGVQVELPTILKSDRLSDMEIFDRILEVL